MIDSIIQKIDELLRKAQFETFSFKGTSKRNQFCFDLLVKKGEAVFLVKVLPNIDNLNETVIENIKHLSTLLNSKPLLIGIKNRYQNLDDDTIYIRNDLPFITVNTLEKIIQHREFPYVLARRGGNLIFIDGALMKTLREQKNLSRKEISDRLGVTKRTICSYENETMRPSQSVAEQILKLLEEKSLFKKINLFEWQVKVNFNDCELSNQFELSEFESHLKSIFDDIGVSTLWYKKGQFPFELSIASKNFITDSKSEFYPLFSGISREDTKISKLNLEYLESFAKIFHKNALFIANNDFKIPDIFNRIKVPVIKLKKLEKLDNEEEFIDMVHEN